MTTPLPECIPGRFQVDPRTIQHRRTRRPTQRRLRCSRGVWTRTSRLDTTNINTIIVRAPGSGAIVSDQYSRKTVELAQWDLLGNPDYVSAVDNYVASVSSDSTPWGLVTVGLCLVIVAAVVCTFLSLTLRVRASEKSARLKGPLAM